MVPDTGDICAHRDVRHAGALGKRTESHADNTVGNNDAGQVGTIFKRKVSDISDAVWNCVGSDQAGYNDAMVLSLKIKLQPLFFALMLFVWISYAGLLFYCAIKKMRKHVIFLILGFGTLFLNYKMGYTRQDFEHLICFYSMWVFVFGLYFLLSFADTKFIRYFVLLFISIMLYECYADSVWWNIPIFRNLYKFDSIADRQSLQLCFNLLRGTGTDDRLRLVKIKTYLMQYFPLKAETVGMLSGHTMDVFPSEITITEAYGFKWDPRPVFQSYSAYTEYLDTLNAKHFSSDSAPQYVLYALHTVDDRYAIFDEPATFRTLLQKYKPCAVDGNFIVLRQTPSPDTITEKYLGRADVGFNKLILLPRVDNELLFMKIHIEYSLTGLITRLLYKPQNVFFGFFDEKKHFIDKPRRLIFTNSNDGLFVGRYIANQNDLLEIWNGNIQQNIAGILLHTDCPAFFKDKITLRFFTIPITKQSGGK